MIGKRFERFSWLRRSSIGYRYCTMYSPPMACCRSKFKPAYSVGDLLTQHLDELEEEAERKGGVLQALTDHFTKVYRVPLPLAA